MQLQRTLTLSLALLTALLSSARGEDAPPWVEPAQAVHYRFTGRKGTFAQFGDSITFSGAYWYPLAYRHNNMNPATQKAYENVNAYMMKSCWSTWKGPKYGSQVGKNILWAADHIDEWLKELNPEAALILFGADDLGQVPIDQYEQKLREVIQKCTDNGTAVILSTLPPHHDMMDKVQQYSDVIRKISVELKLPLIDFLNEILTRRPDDWDETTHAVRATMKANPNFATLLSWDGIHLSYGPKYTNDYSEEGLRNCGYGLRTYLTLMAYDQLIDRAFK